MAVRKPSNGVEKLNTVAKLISEAQTLDANGDELGAYRHYLSCVAQMAQTLSSDIQANQGQGTLTQLHCEQLFKMARNCLDRGEKIYNCAKSEQRPLALFRLASPSPTVSPTTFFPPSVSESKSTSTGGPPERSKSWSHGPPHHQSSLVNVRAVGGTEEPVAQTRPIHQLSYIERAKLRNAQMMEKYKAVLRESRSTHNLPSDVRLSMLRRFDENMGVAKIKEETIARRLREREFRLAQETRERSHAPLVTLTVDEICDHVTSFEHGKSAISSIKARLNTSGTELIYSTVAEILAMTEHPLARLLAEGQFQVYTVLQPLVTAIEKAGGLPKLEIRLDNCSLDRKPFEDLTEESAESAVQPPNDEEDDDLLDLLTEEDEDFLADMTTSTRSSDSTHSEPLYHRLESPKTSSDNDYHVLESLAPEPSEEFSVNPNVAYGTVGVANMGMVKDEEPRYVYRVSAVSPPKNEVENVYSIPRSSKCVSMSNRRDSPLYEQLDKLRVNDHIYERLDAIEATDGAFLSRPSEEVEPVFKNLPPLVCATHYGDEASLNKLSDTAGSVVKEAVKNIRKLLSTLEEVFGKCYPVLSSEENSETVASVLEASFFPPVLKQLTLVYRCKNYKEECSTATNMCRHVNATPKDLAVRDKYWLINQTYAPYGEAIDELRRVPSFAGPTPKLNGLVKLSKRIIQCINDYHTSQENSTTSDSAVGVDDLLPILSYVIIRTGLPQLVSEASVMEEFIRDGYMRGEEGFCLTSFMTALKFVSHMSS